GAPEAIRLSRSFRRVPECQIRHIQQRLALSHIDDPGVAGIGKEPRTALSDQAMPGRWRLRCGSCSDAVAVSPSPRLGIRHMNMVAIIIFNMPTYGHMTKEASAADHAVPAAHDVPAPRGPGHAATGYLPVWSPRPRSRRKAVITLVVTVGGLVVLLVVASS